MLRQHVLLWVVLVLLAAAASAVIALKVHDVGWAAGSTTAEEHPVVLGLA